MVVFHTVVVISGCGFHDPTNGQEPVALFDDAGPSAAIQPPVITVTLPGESAEMYRTSEEGPALGTLARRLETRFPHLKVVPCLERAAGIYGRTAGADALPLAFSEFVLHWSGCPDPFAAVIHVLTNDNGDDEFFNHLAEMLATVPATHVGVSKDPATEPYDWRWTVFLTERDVEMQPVPTSVSPGSSVAVLVRFLQPVDGASVISTLPDGRVVETGGGLSGDRLLAAVEVADRPGTQWIEVVATDASGPHVVLLFPVEIGRAPPRAWVGPRRRSEDWITDPVSAEAYAHILLDEDRTRFGLPALVHDDVLSAVARRHSAEMARSGEIAHVSSTTGTVVDRLKAAGFHPRFAAENIARSSTIADAQEGLMRSPGHRAAILSTDANRVGIGIVTVSQPETGVVYFITQIFARPVGETG
jgi:Cysteine-rich secretory protein family